jgi:alpha-ketoglutarate-dependent 2,4-dichlorophenoxyacetate dioxygenase
MADVSNLDVEGRTRGRDDRQRMFSLGNQLWHTDSSFREVPGALSILHLHGAPPSWGGETEFTDMRVAYDALPARRKARLDGLVAEHSLMHSRSLLGFADFSAEERAAMPPVRQPVVRRHEGSGRKTLYLASHASHIIGMPVPDGRMLLRDLIEFATQREFVHTHSWAEGDLVMWDNRCTLHRGRAYDEMEKRDLRRVTTSDARPGIEMAA